MQKAQTPARPLLQALDGAPVLDPLWRLAWSQGLIPGMEGIAAPRPLWFPISPLTDAM